MSMQKKPQMVEAVMFFNEPAGICKEMLYAEFEALLDGVVNMPEFADRQMRMAYLLINPRLLVRSAVFFYLDFDEKGGADKGWNIPLRHLADTAGRGPDLGAGPIRLACRSQCPVSWHQMHLWDPSLTPGHNDLASLRDVVKRNHMGLLIEEDLPQLVAPERLQMASEDRWYPTDPLQQEAEQQAQAHAAKNDQEQRLKAAQLIKQQRLRLSSLAQQHEEELAKFRLASDVQNQSLRAEIHDLQQALHQQEELNLTLKKQLSEQAGEFQSGREQMTAQLRALELHAQAEADILRGQFASELQAKVAAAVVEYKEQIAIRDVELAYRNELDTQLEQEVARLKRERDEFAGQGSEQVLQRLSKLGVVFVVYHPGAGHLTIPLADMVRYQDNPMAYVAAKCFVTETQYREWLAHYQTPTCAGLLASGERCAMPLERVDSPSRFVIGQSNCCVRHRSAEAVRPAG